MRNPLLILCVVLATLFACNSDSMSTDDMNKKGGERPFKIKNLEGTYTLGQTAADCGPATLTAIGEGTIAHLGKSMLLEEWCFDNRIPNDLGERSILLTAANGDELHGFHTSIQFAEDGLSFMEEFTIDGGTGRFENAQGTVTEYVELVPSSPFTGTYTLNAEGTISY